MTTATARNADAPYILVVVGIILASIAAYAGLLAGIAGIYAPTVTGTPHADPHAVAVADPLHTPACDTDAECAAWSIEHGQPLGYGADKAGLSDAAELDAAECALSAQPGTAAYTECLHRVSGS